MSQKIRLWEVTQQDTLSEITSDEIDLEQRLEEWLANDISLLDPDLLVIGRQVRTAYDGEIDLLCSLIVAESMDARTERIVRYLSELNVPINVATVQHFVDGSGREILAQVFLVEPEETQTRAWSTSKRRNLPDVAQMKEITHANGVSELYDRLRAGASGILNVAPYSQTSLGFYIKTEEGLSTMFVVELGESDQERGLAFRLNGIRLRNAFGLTPEQLDSILPKDREQTSEWKGALQRNATISTFATSRV